MTVLKGSANLEAFDTALRISKESVALPQRQRRLTRARLTGKALARIAATRWGCRFLLFVRTSAIGRALLDSLAGFRRIFPTLEAARLCAATYLPFDHSHPDNASLHLRLAERLRPSDYPVLFHLQNIVLIEPLLPALKTLSGGYMTYLPLFRLESLLRRT